MISNHGLGHGIFELLHHLLIAGPSHSSIHWICWLLRQPNSTDCILKCYWILLLLWQHVSTNHTLIVLLLLLGRRLKDSDALYRKVGETE